jgi:hypothetical protein
MLERLLRYILLVAITAAPLSGCGYMSKSGRQQMAYQRYIRKSSSNRMKVQKKMKTPKMPRTPGPSGNKVNSGVSDSPQSVRSGESETSN